MGGPFNWRYSARYQYSKRMRDKVDGIARPSECTSNNYVLRKYGLRNGQFEMRTQKSGRTLPDYNP